MTRQHDPAEAFVYDAWARSYVATITGGTNDTPAPVEPAQYLARALVKLRQRVTPRAPAEPDDSRDSASRAIRQAIADRLGHAETRVYLACAADDPRLFLGFACCSRGLVHYVYVKKNLRDHGVARQMIEHAATDIGVDFDGVTAVTWPWTYDYAKRKGWAYDPQSRARTSPNTKTLRDADRADGEHERVAGTDGAAGDDRRIAAGGG